MCECKCKYKCLCCLQIYRPTGVCYFVRVSIYIYIYIYIYEKLLNNICNKFSGSI